MSQTISGSYTIGVTLSGNPATIATGSTIGGTASAARGVYGPAGTAWTLTNQLQELDDAVGSPCHKCRDGEQTFHQGLLLAPRIVTSPPDEPELQCHPLTLNRPILQPPVFPAVTRLRVLATVWAPLISFADRRDQPSTVQLLGADDAHVGSEGPMTHLFHVTKIVGDRRRSTQLHGGRQQW
jgi:hypothetical protein